ncbi:MAG: hypothetical protein GX365_07045 [Clostridiales bacterium]|nr:hypothetical protein [Clostridiales bacterium]
MPKAWITLYDFDDRYMGYLDYNQLNGDSEPSVIMTIYKNKEYIVTEKIAGDLGDFILQLVEEQLKKQ